MFVAARFLLLCAVWLFVAPAEASTGEEAILVSPSVGPAGQTVMVSGTGWREHGTRGIDVPISIGFANIVARGQPDANGEFRVTFTIPPSSPSGDLEISAIIGNGGSADTFYTVTSATEVAHTPGWYHNSASVPLYEDSDLRIVWDDSYIYPYPGGSALYWYAKVVYFYKGSKTFNISCAGESTLPPVTEYMRGTPNSGSVAAEETLCDRNTNFTITLKQTEAFYDWAIFHNVPWLGGEVSLQWDPYGSSEWVDPWHSPYPPEVSPPAECPTELVALGTCRVPVPDIPIKENLPLLDIVRTVVSGWKAVCDIQQCQPSIPLNIVSFLQKTFTVLNLSAVQRQALQFSDALKTVNQAIAEHGPKSPEVRQAVLGPLCQATLNIHNAVLSIGINRAVFPPPIAKCNAPQPPPPLPPS